MPAADTADISVDTTLDIMVDIMVDITTVVITSNGATVITITATALGIGMAVTLDITTTIMAGDFTTVITVTGDLDSSTDTEASRFPLGNRITVTTTRTAVRPRFRSMITRNHLVR